MDKKRPKIGIVTYHTAINYGAVLQAYALNKKINGLGLDCDTIDYQCPAVNRQYTFRRWKDSTSWKNFIAHNITCFFHRQKKKQFHRFLKNIPLSESCNRDTVNRVTTDYDILITGSDQVFNPVCHQSDPTYFLDFAPKEKKKVSYAASLGSIRQFETLKFDPWVYLKQFDSLSFREQEAADYVSRQLERPCAAVMDPVWLLSKEEWGSIARHTADKPYIFVYNLMDYGYMRKYVRTLSRKTGLPVISVSRTIMGDAMYFGMSKVCSNCSPNAFLGYIRDAAFVVTDSFHGTSFSLLLEKPFFAAMNPAEDNTNSRLNTILQTAGLQERAISPDRLIYDTDMIDYEPVKAKLNKEISYSLTYLQNNLQID